VNPQVTVVVPNRNGGDSLVRVLRAVEAQDYPARETVVVDDASTDGSLERATELVPSVRTVRFERNRGFAAAANAGAAAARGEFVAFLNNDAVPEPTWLRSLVECIEAHPRAACVDSKLYRSASEGVLDGAGDAITWALKAYRRGAGTSDRNGFSGEEQVLLAAGTACLWRASAFQSLGGFAEQFFAYYEDVDLSLRARRAGYEIWFAPGAVAWHGTGESSRASRRELEGLVAVRNRWATIVRNAPGWWLWRRAPLILLAEAMQFSRAALTGDGGLYLRAAWASARMLPGWRRERRSIIALGTLDAKAVAPFVDRRLPPLRSSLDRKRRAVSIGRAS
jgi:GT2 family glycosyltransferase